MCEIVTILERELGNSDLIYIYREQDNKWYAYEQSAFCLSQMIPGLSIKRYVMEGILWLAKVEVDIDQLPRENIISYSKTEYVLHYTSHNGFYEWLAEIKE